VAEVSNVHVCIDTFSSTISATVCVIHIATMTHKAVHTGNLPYLANLVQWHTPCRTLRSASANLLSVTRCNISFGTRGFRSAAPTIWNSLPSHVRSCETLTTFRRHLKAHFFHSALPTA